MKIVIAEDIPSHNKGEEALFIGLVESLKLLGPSELFLFSLNPESDSRNYQGQATIVDARGITPAHMLDSLGSTWKKTCNLLQFFFKYASFALLYKLMGNRATAIMTHPVWKKYCEADLILLGHDSFFAPRYHGTLALFCFLLKKPAVFYAGTTENPLFHAPAGTKDIARWLLRSCLEKLPLILLREETSRSNLKKLGMDTSTGKIAVHTDLAFLVEPASKEDAVILLEKEGIPRNRPIIGMTMSQRKFHFAYRHLPLEERIEKGMEAMAALVDHMTENLGATVVFLPHSIGPSTLLDDRIAAENIRQRAKQPEHIFNMRTEYSVRQLKAIAGEFDLAVGARLHFIIDAVCQYVPSLLITHIGDTRCHGIFGQMLGLERWVYNIDTVEKESLIALTQKLWDTRAAEKQIIIQKLPEIKEDTYEHGKKVQELLRTFPRQAL